MNPMTLLFLAGAVLLFWSAFTGNNPLKELTAIVSPAPAAAKTKPKK